MSSGPTVVKIGGSLFDLPDLGRRLHAWLTDQKLSRLLLVPGGGPTADVVRALDRRHGLGEEAAHWLALRALALNAWLLGALFPEGRVRVVSGCEECESLWSRALLPVLDAHAFARADEGRPGCLPHRWSATSDSVAARAAVVLGASELILLKSISLPAGVDWREAGQRGFVDPLFWQIAAGLPSVRAVNLREWPSSPGPTTGPAGEPPRC
jgi:aspartokinase-like uncharacterized kinase